ncbi:MAG: putative Na+/H+ antiporter, partial [Azoarcus sp.]|nr:putative Na+/H+ antiporter [Azoarcus sp.]
MTPTIIQVIGSILFAVAILHTFSVSFFLRLAEKHPAHAGLWGLFAEAEFIFGFWAGILLISIAAIEPKSGDTPAVAAYLKSLSYTEPLFVLAIMIVAASKPIIIFASTIVRQASRLLPIARPLAFYFTILAVVPLLSSFITEPAAMALAA